MTELPLLVIDVQRGGPSTGLPTKTEQADLLQAMFGRNGEAPVPIVAPQSPGDCFDAAIEAARIAITYRTPVMLLSDGYLANGSEPWRIPELADLPGHRPELRDRAQQDGHGEGRHRVRGVLALPARRGDPGPPVGDPRHARPRAPHRRSREGRGPRQHLLRPGQPRLHGPHPPGQGRPDRRLAAAAGGRRPVRRGEGAGASAGARRTARSAPAVAGSARPATTSPRCTCATSTRSRTTSARSSSATTRCSCPEMNLGQLSLLLRGKYLVDAIGYNQVNGMPIKAADARRGHRRPGRRGRGHHRRPHACDRPAGGIRVTTDRDLPFPGLRSGVELVPTNDEPQTGKEYTSDQEVRWCPGLRRLRRAQGRPGLPARAGPAPREHRLRLRHRLLLAVPLLPRHLRHALDPRPRAVDRDRHRHRPRGPLGLGRHR